MSNFLDEFNGDIDFFKSKEICTVSKDTDVSGLEEMKDSMLTRYANKHCHLIADLETIGLPKEGEQFRLITRRNFNTVQFLDYISKKETITNLKIAIYSINYFAAKLIIDLVNEGRIKKVEMLMSNLRNKAHREKERIIKELLVENENIDLFFCSSHAKVFSCKTEAGNYYTLEGSGNMSYNSRIEQYSIDNDKILYDFTCQWFEEIREFLKGKKELSF